MTPTPVAAVSPGAMRVVTVEAPGRLHLGFLDPAGTLGRPFGSLGLIIDGPCTRVSLREAGMVSAPDLAHPESCGGDTAAAADTEWQRAQEHLQRLQQITGCHQPLHLRLETHLAPHAGLGSGTQLALAVGRAFARWHRLEVSTPTLAHWLGRGRRSGVGIAGFDGGGLLLDGGPLQSGEPAPLLARVALPPAWRVLLVSDPTLRGLSGAQERAALASVPPLSQACAAQLCHETLMRVLPGAAGAGFAPFAAGLSHIQDILGGHFAPAQQGESFTSAAVGRVLRWIRHQAEAATDGAPAEALGAGVGQSSWGPTGFAVLPSAERASALLAQARSAGVVAPHLHCQIVAPRARGACTTEAWLPESSVALARGPAPLGLSAVSPLSSPLRSSPRWNVPTSSTCSPRAPR